jgi:hypothetical protein
MSERQKYNQLFDYLSTPEHSDNSTGLLVFGRKDPLVARKVVELAGQERAKWAVISGGTGKDSGDLTIPEAEYLARETENQANESGVVLPPLYLETQAQNGGENSRNSLAVMQRAQLEYKTGLTAVAHATSSRRLAAMLEHAAVQQGSPIEKIYREPSDYQFDPTNPTDQLEASAELLRLVNWPKKNWLLEQNDLPQDLVDFVEDTHKK